MLDLTRLTPYLIDYERKRGSVVEALKLLEKKIVSLVKMIKEQKTESNALKKENEALKAEGQELKIENAKLAEESSQLAAKVTMIEGSSRKDNKRLETLNQERTSTKLVVDDLIKSIDALVKNEKQR